MPAEGMIDKPTETAQPAFLVEPFNYVLRAQERQKVKLIRVALLPLILMVMIGATAAILGGSTC